MSFERDVDSTAGDTRHSVEQRALFLFAEITASLQGKYAVATDFVREVSVGPKSTGQTPSGLSIAT